ncbi:MAG: sortase [Chloroflexi bacterium]|nr:MAG: sortase [Chloroflexota bacterium]
MKLKDPKTLVEQIALLMASFIWTVIVLAAIIFFWVYQDVQARWDAVLNPPPQAALAQAPPVATPSPTLWAGPGATLTPTPTLPPTPLATRVIGPEVLPETLNPGETPVPVIVHTNDEAQEFGVDQNQPVTVNFLPTATPGSGDAAIGGGMPTHLTIESVGIDSDVIPVGWSVIQKDGQEYSIWQVADYAVGWHKTSALLGQPGNTVMAGHHNVNGEVFRDLVNVEVGDKVVISAGNQKFEYVVDLKTIVKEKGEPVEVRKRNAQWIAPTADERITFVTCWPYTNNTHRVIVVAKPARG